MPSTKLFNICCNYFILCDFEWCYVEWSLSDYWAIVEWFYVEWFLSNCWVILCWRWMPSTKIFHIYCNYFILYDCWMMFMLSDRWVIIERLLNDFMLSDFWVIVERFYVWWFLSDCWVIIEWFYVEWFLSDCWVILCWVIVEWFFSDCWVIAESANFLFWWETICVIIM